MPVDELSLDFNSNIFKMTVMWSASSFCYYMMQVFNKYLEGTIFQNVLMDSVSGLVAVCITSPFYFKYSVRTTLMFSFMITLISGQMIFMLEANYIDPIVMYKMGLS